MLSGGKVENNDEMELNLHELVRQFKYENQILNTINTDLNGSYDLTHISKKNDSE